MRIIFSLSFISDEWKAMTSPLTCKSLSVPSPITTSPLPFGKRLIEPLEFVEDITLPSNLRLSIFNWPVIPKVPAIVVASRVVVPSTFNPSS